MNKKRAAAPVCKTDDGEGQTRLEGFDELPNFDCITEFQPRQGSVASLLLRGCENALTAGELSRISGLDRRDVCRQIQTERLDGAPILSCGRGFFLAEDGDELQRCVSSLWSRIREQIKTANALGELGEAER